MADEKKPMGRLILVSGSKPGPQNPPPTLPPRMPMRTQEELTPVAQRVLENVALMQRFRSAVGSDDEPRVRAVIDEVRNYAQTLDPTITYAEGARIAFVLGMMIGHFKAEG